MNTRHTLEQLLKDVNALKVLEKRLHACGGTDSECVALQARISDLYRELNKHEALRILLPKLPGEMNRSYIVQKVIDAIKGKTYVEIGVDQGACFAAVNVPLKMGIDPTAPSAHMQTLLRKRSVRYFQMKSDDFFAQYSELLSAENIDVAFIDGLHTYEQSLRDVHNCLRYLHDDGVILLHDCNPQSEASALEASSPKEARLHAQARGLQLTSAWCGDVWKTVIHLRSYEKNLSVLVLDCDMGIGVITRGKSSELLGYSACEIEAMTYAQFAEMRATMLNLKPQEYLFDFVEHLKRLGKK